MADNDIILTTANLALGYGARRVLNDVTLEVRRGEFWCVLGTNGSGKTSLLRAILNLLPPQSGRLWLHPTVASRERIGFVPQRCDLNPTLPTTVREFVVLGCVGLRLDGAERERRLTRALDTAGLSDQRRRDYWSLSGGLRQRALIARALVREPTLLLLDEPTSGLDPATEDSLLRLLAALNREQHLTVLFVTHELDIAARHATHVALLHDGRVLAGARDTVLNPENLSRIYGVGIESGSGDSLPRLRGRTLGGHT